MKPDIKIVSADVGKPDGDPRDLENRLKDLMEIGYALHNAPVAVGEILIYTLVHPGEKERISNVTAYPTERQLGYICWAYRVSDDIVEDARVFRKEASALIEHHKEQSEGTPFPIGTFKKRMDVLRHGQPAPEAHTGQKRTTRKPPEAPDNELPFDDDDVPF